MTNPDNIVRVRARNGGRASVYEANGWAQAYSAGLLEGNGVKQNTSADMNVLVGGSTTKPDVVLAQNAAGYRVALDIVGQQAVAITKPASNSRISAIVAYTDDLSLGTTEDTVTGSPSTCGLIVVNGTAASSPSEPTDTQIRNAITADGATGSQAAYCVIATILVASNTTTITDSLITNKAAKLAGTGVVSSSNIDLATIPTIDTNTVLKDIGGLTSTYYYTSEYTGYLTCEIAVPPGKGGTCAVELSIDGTNYVPVAGGGWIVMAGNTRYTENVCVPVSVGAKIKFTCNSDLPISSVKIYAIKWQPA